MRAKKHLGQNFLSSSSILKKMVVVSGIKDTDVVLEIGPGRGSLTTELLGSAKKVIAIEKDEELIPRLIAQFAEEIHSGKLELIHGDILNLFPANSQLQANYKVVANIPYYITGQLLRLLLSCYKQPSSITLVVQKEVAQRIVAQDSKESILSLSVKAYGNPKLIQKIPARYFNPKPKVDSAVIHISNISKDNFTSKKQEQLFFTILKAGFAHKRKLLSNNLEVVFDKNIIQKIFKEFTIPTNARAENIPLETWLKIVNFKH